VIAISPAEILNSSQSYEARATQECSKIIAEMFLTNEEVESLMKELQSTPLKDKEKAIQNFHIMLKVHRKISENSHLFYNLCDSLESLNVVHFKNFLQGTEIIN